MPLFRPLLAAALFAAFAASPCPAAGPQPPVFDIPRLDGIGIDGDDADWGGRGFRIDILTDRDGAVRTPEDFDPVARLGWDARGLLVLVAVRDNAVHTSDAGKPLWNGDSVEVYFAPERGAKRLFEVVGAPESDGDGVMRVHSCGYRNAPAPKNVTAQTAWKKSGQGYRMEMLLPWAAIGGMPRSGARPAVQICVNDADPGGALFKAQWHPGADTHENTDAAHAVRPSRRASPPVTARVAGRYDEFAQTQARVVAVDTLAGSAVTAELDGARADAVLAEEAGRAVAAVTLPMPANEGDRAPVLRCRVGGKALPAALLPPAAEARGRMILAADIGPKYYVIKNGEFPRCDFANPLLGERLLGPYRVETAYYDSDGRPADGAPRRGRYGAVIRIAPASGAAPVVRYRSLFSIPEGVDGFRWLLNSPTDGGVLHRALGVPERTQQAYEQSIGRFYDMQLLQSLNSSQDLAVLLATLNGAGDAPAPVRRNNDPWAADRQWWTGLKRALRGEPPAAPFVCPRPLAGPPAPVLRDGGEAEAGMKAGAGAALDAVLTEWAGTSEEAFAVAVARDGVLFFHKAYGVRAGRPMAEDTRSWMASISKFMSGTLMMMLVDQGLVNLDDPVDRYLPELRGAPGIMLTVRDLYVHTNGLALGHRSDHWGDEMHDLEQVIAGYYPFLKPRAGHAYNGVGYAIGGKVIEAVSGEALPAFFLNHLLGPLGMGHTDAVDGSALTRSTALDMARFGQMMLNGGAYGDRQFLRPETLGKMMPRPLTDLLGPETKIEWGIGAVRMPEEGLSPQTFGHGAASSATLRIDPEHRLVVVMTRDSGGPRFGEFHPRFIRAIAEHLPD
jgi:CubicO group peptidase (beta-lactamase class C family)